MSEIVSERPAAPGLRTGRIEALSDGVFSIAMTLLVLELKVPDADVNGSALIQTLVTTIPHVGIYALSFLILGIYWVGHHNQFYYIRRANRELLWINILYLGVIAFIPFSTALLGSHLRPDDEIALIVYAANLIAAGLVLYLHWWYGTQRARLVETPVEPHLMATVTRRILTPPLVYLLAIGVSFVSIEASIGVIILVQLFYVLPAHLDLHFVGRGAHADEAQPGAHIHPPGEH